MSTIVRPPQTSPEDPRTPEVRKKRKGLITGAIVGGTALLAAGGLAFGINIANGQKSPDRLVATDTPNPGEETGEEIVDTPETPESGLWYERINTDPTAEDVVIQVSEVAPEQLPELWADRVTMWDNAGFSQELIDNFFTNTYDQDTRKLAAEYDAVFIDSLFAPGWESNPNVSAVISRISDIHQYTIAVGGQTGSPDITPANIEPYMRGMRVVGESNIVINPDGSVQATFQVQDYDNADLNRVGDPDFYESVTGEVGTMQFTWVDVDGEYKISNMIFDQ